ncbi:MAG: hypothetical protein E6J91_28785 [Deltaproteobacteria bacterium]|nr:MAG: hypothetical protein E6J91_28785 [Deltaproteobacteria bacterium]
MLRRIAVAVIVPALARGAMAEPDSGADETITVTGEAPPLVQGAGVLVRADLERLPGGGNDAIRSLDAMPGVVNFQLPLAESGVVIRGASPQDSKILVDGFEIPRLYHDIGFRSIVPAEAIDQLDYIPGGFDVAFGRATSGIVDVTTRAGGDQTHQQAEMSSADGGVLAQGAMPGGRYLVAFRRSVIDQLLPALLPDDLDLSLTTVPRYYDEQLRIDYAPSPRWSLRLSSVGSDDVLALYTSHMLAPDKRLYDRTRFVRVTTAARYRDGAWTADLAVSGIAQQAAFERGSHQHLSVTSPGVTARGEATRWLGDVAGLGAVSWRIGGELAVSRSTIDLALPRDRREGEPNAADDPMDTSQRFTGEIWTPDFGVRADPRRRDPAARRARGRAHPAGHRAPVGRRVPPPARVPDRAARRRARPRARDPAGRRRRDPAARRGAHPGLGLLHRSQPPDHARRRPADQRRPRHERGRRAVRHAAPRVVVRLAVLRVLALDARRPAGRCDPPVRLRPAAHAECRRELPLRPLAARRPVPPVLRAAADSRPRRRVRQRQQPLHADLRRGELGSRAGAPPARPAARSPVALGAGEDDLLPRHPERVRQPEHARVPLQLRLSAARSVSRTTDLTDGGSARRAVTG